MPSAALAHATAAQCTLQDSVRRGFCDSCAYIQTYLQHTVSTTAPLAGVFIFILTSYACVHVCNCKALARDWLVHQSDPLHTLTICRHHPCLQSFEPHVYVCMSAPAAREHVIGWYSTGPRLREADLSMHQLMTNYCSNPVLVICEVEVRCLNLFVIG
jgi:hypothetical protein